MHATVSGLAGYRGLRGEIIVALKMAQPLTVKELAGRFGVTPNGLRRYLKDLEEEGIVRYRREVRGVGSPVFAYSLAEAGEALFPQAYRSVLADALDMVRETQGEQGVVAVFRRRWDALAEAARPRLSELSREERARLLSELLTSEGYMAEVEGDGTGAATLREHHCPVRGIAERNPEVCEAEARFIERVVGATVTRRQHIISGCNVCEYSVPAPSSEAAVRVSKVEAGQKEKA
jgi:DeoR family transcriptional regulator, suf operon transcriptional repressor